MSLIRVNTDATTPRARRSASAAYLPAPGAAAVADRGADAIVRIRKETPLTGAPRLALRGAVQREKFARPAGRPRKPLINHKTAVDSCRNPRIRLQEIAIPMQQNSDCEGSFAAQPPRPASRRPLRSSRSVGLRSARFRLR
jgi:hypothetical protein